MSDYTVNDRRARPSRLITSNLDAEMRSARSRIASVEASRQQGALDERVFRSLGARLKETDPEVTDMRKRRLMSMRRGASNTPGGSDLSLATGRPKDPMWYWKANNLPYEVEEEEQLSKVRAFCRLLYMTHPIIASAIDIFSKYPLTGMELKCKDKSLTDFYSTLFLDQLDYEEFLLDVGREYWTVGEAWPLGSFNEMLGVWEDDQLINPDNMRLTQNLFATNARDKNQYRMRLPESLRKVLKERSPHAQYEALMRYDSSLVNYANDNDYVTVSQTLMNFLRFKGDTFNPRGIPILMRAMRSVMQEEVLNAAQDAVADRLYTPLILVKLGASASDLGTTQPWIPQEDDILDFEEALDSALAADFRVLTHHFAVDMAPVFGREVVPDFMADFERLEDRQLQVFGMSRTMLSGASSGETYAADAMNRDLISQLLTHYQRLIKKHYERRALAVAEAQDHFDYEVRGGKRYPIMEEILEIDEETGEQRIVERPKLLIPTLELKTMNIRDEQGEQQFYEALRASGVPISAKTRMINIPIDLDDEAEATSDEQVQMAVLAQETRKKTYLALKAAKLPIPEDLLNDFEPKAMQAQPDKAAAEETRPMLLGIDAPASDSALAPTPFDLSQPPGVAPSVDGPTPDPAMMGGATVIPLPRNQNPSVPPESHEMAGTMPRAASLDEDGNERTPSRLEVGLTHIGRLSPRAKKMTTDTPLGEEPHEATG